MNRSKFHNWIINSPIPWIGFGIGWFLYFGSFVLESYLNRNFPIIHQYERIYLNKEGCIYEEEKIENET